MKIMFACDENENNGICKSFCILPKYLIIFLKYKYSSV